MKIYGIKNCDTVKKAIKWLVDNGIEVELHDYRLNGLDHKFLTEIVNKFGWENVINKRSTTWRGLSDEIRNNLNSELVVKVLIDYPTLIKRPIILNDGIALLGFNIREYQTAFKKID